MNFSAPEEKAIRICPSILNADRDDLPAEINRISRNADWLHVDVMDGKFVPATTFNIVETKSIIETSSLPVDAHLMIESPDELAAEYAAIGARSITFHFEASVNPKKTLQGIRASGSRASVGIKPLTPVEVLYDLVDFADMFLVMTVEPGAGGQPFMQDMLPKVRNLRDFLMEHKYPQWIQVDGGITLETIALATAAGADTFVAGSSIYKTSDPARAVDELRRVALGEL